MKILVSGDVCRVQIGLFGRVHGYECEFLEPAEGGEREAGVEDQ